MKEQLIIESATDLFWKYWVKKVSVDMIVERAWVAKGTFYLYFKTKIELYKRIIDSNFEEAEKIMKVLFQEFPDVKERLVNFLVWSIIYFKKNSIIRNMVLWENNYYIWNIDIKYLEIWYEKMLKILLKDFLLDCKKNDIKSGNLEFLSKLMWNFKQVLLLEKKCFENEKQFDDFVLNYARVLINGYFSDYKEISKKFDKTLINKII